MSDLINDIISTYNYGTNMVIINGSFFRRRKLDPMHAYILMGQFNVVEVYDVDEHGEEKHICYQHI